MNEYDILECQRRPTALGTALYIRIHRKDMQIMRYSELWAVFTRFYPGKWAMQVLPPAGSLIDMANKYHLFVYDEAPAGMDLSVPNPKGTWLVGVYKSSPGHS